MALVVEAAELAEIFQWMTPEQSQAARGDLVLQEQVADEVADVLLYLARLSQLGADTGAKCLIWLVARPKVFTTRRLRPGLVGELAWP